MTEAGTTGGANSREVWQHAVFPTITMIAVSPFAIWHVLEVGAFEGMWGAFVPFFGSLLAAPGFLWRCHLLALSRSRPGWAWALTSSVFGALCAAAGAIFGAFTIMFGVLGTLSCISAVGVTRRLWRSRRRSGFMHETHG
ncbi:MAG: hypothetical protein GX607_09935 [Myxococcales bacterium]|nr:hypothetical protein [Myxococcales bacterium]